MSKRVGRYAIEHWRDGELIGRVELTSKMVDAVRTGRVAWFSRRAQSLSAPATNCTSTLTV